jgi:Peptidase M50B-like
MTLQDVLITFSRRDVLSIVVLGLLSVVLRQVPGLNLLLYPFWLFNTFIHELAHIFALRATGGQYARFGVRPDHGGITPGAGGVGCIVASVGYLSEIFLGGFLILLTTSTIPARVILIGLGVLLALICFLFVGNFFGFVAGLAVAAIFYYLGWQLDERGAATILLFVAVQMILSTFDGLFKQLRASRRGGGGSDAELLERFTAIPALVWALLWCALAVAVLVWSITTAYRDLPLY